jgi:hypothetical protein
VAEPRLPIQHSSTGVNFGRSHVQTSGSASGRVASVLPFGCLRACRRKCCLKQVSTQSQFARIRHSNRCKRLPLGELLLGS